MAKLTLTRIDLSIYNKEDQTTVPARFYVRQDNDVSMSIYNTLKRSLFGSKFGSTGLHSVKTSPVVNPTSKEPFTTKMWNKEAGAEIDEPVFRLESFSTGYNPNGEDKQQNYVVQLIGVSFKTQSKDGNDYNIEKRFERDFQGVEKGAIKNLEALQYMNNALKDDATCEAVIDKNDNATYYISKFAE